MKKLAAWAGGVAVTTVVYHQATSVLPLRADAVLLGVISVVAFECVAVQMLWTWKWRALSLGLLSFFLATGLLYFRVSATAFGYELWQADAMLSLIRSLYLVGAVLTAWGLTRWAWHYRDAAFPWMHQVVERDPFVPPDREG